VAPLAETVRTDGGHDWILMNRFTTARRRRRPKHARPSVLAPSRSLAGAVGVTLAIGFGLTGAAALLQGPAGAVTRAGAPAAAPVSVPRSGTAGGPLAGEGARLGPADDAALRGTGAGSSGRRRAHSSAPRPRDAAPASALAAGGIPATALQAYQQAAAGEAARSPACGLSWPLLAGIGRVESDHGRFAGAVLHSDGLSTPRVIGIPLDGHGTALIRDTDGGRLDGDTGYDRAVGPMQFIPSTWAGWGVDADGDGVADPFNVFDAAAAAADYLCAAGRDLTTTRGQVQAILSYNYSWDYVSLVMSLERVYASGVGITVPVLPTTPEPRHGRPAHKPVLPPVDPGRPRGAARAPSGHPRATAPTGPTGDATPSLAPHPGPGLGGTSAPGSSSSPAPTESPGSSASPSPSTSASTSTSSSSIDPPAAESSTTVSQPADVTSSDAPSTAADSSGSTGP
jgi:hypothetical protein